MSEDKSSKDKLLEEFLKICEELRKQASEKGLTKEEFYNLISEILTEEIDGEDLKKQILDRHDKKVKEFLDLCHDLRQQAMNKGMSKEKLKLSILSIMFEEQMLADIKKKEEPSTKIEPNKKPDRGPDEPGRGR